MEYIKRSLIVILIVILLLLFFHLFIFIALAGFIIYMGYKLYLKMIKQKEKKNQHSHLKVKNVIIDAEYTEKK